MTTQDFGQEDINLQAFADGIVKGEFSQEQIKAAAEKIGMDKATLIFDMVNSVDQGSGYKEIAKDDKYQSMDPKTIKAISDNLQNYKDQADMADDDKWSLDGVAIPAIGAGTIGGVYGIKRGVGKLREYLPITSTKARDTANWIRGNTISNFNEDFGVGDKRVNNFIDYMQNMDKKSLKAVSEKGYRGLAQKHKADLTIINDMKQGVLSDYQNVQLGRESVIGELDATIAEMEKTNPTRANAMKKVSAEYHSIFDSKASEMVRELDKKIKLNNLKPSAKEYEAAVKQIYVNVQIPLEQVEGIKEGAWENFDNFDTKVGASAADIHEGEAYRMIGQNTKKALEEATDSRLKELNSQYGKIKSFQKKINNLTNRAGTQNVYSRGRAVGQAVKGGTLNVPFVRESMVTGLSKMAKEERQLPKILERIRKRGDKMKIPVPTQAEVNKVAKGAEEAAALSKKGSKLPVLGKLLTVVGLAAGGLSLLSNETEAGYEGEDNPNINLGEPKYKNTKISDTDSATKAGIKAFEEQESKKAPTGYIEKGPMSKKGEEAVELGASFTPLAPVVIGSDIVKGLLKGDTLKSKIAQKRLKEKQTEASKTPTAGSVSPAPTYKAPAKKKKEDKKKANTSTIGTSFGKSFGGY